jgi:hypothetical protein
MRRLRDAYRKSKKRRADAALEDLLRDHEAAGAAKPRSERAAPADAVSAGAAGLS